MITIDCTCGGQFQILNEQVAPRVLCPYCGANAAELLAQAAPPAAEEAPASFKIACATHPGAQATHNCMNCGKPLCMECVRANGYYCGAECRAAVEAAEPDAADQGIEERAAVGEQLDRTMVKLGKALKIATIVAAVAGLGWVGFAIFQKYTAPTGQVIGQTAVLSEIASFHVNLAGPDSALVQANDDLSLLQLATGQKLWTLNLTTLEEPPTPRKFPVTGEDIPLPSKYRDSLRVAGVNGDTVLLQSSRQLVALNLQDGQPRWKFFDPSAYLGVVTVHDQGVWCAMGNQFVNFALADGARTYAVTNENVSQTFLAGDRVALVSYRSKESAKADLDEGEVLTAGSHAPFDPKAVLAQAMGKPVPTAAPTAAYSLRFVSAIDGHPIGQTTLELPGYLRFEKFDNLLCAVAGPQLLAFGDNADPDWKATLPGDARDLAAGGGVVAALTDSGIVALDAKTGQTKWTRTGLDAAKVAVGPDGSVYVTIQLSKEQALQGEAEKYRIADIAKGGMGTPHPPYTALVRLDPATGKTVWGLRNIGQTVFFVGDKLYVVDHLEQTNLLAAQVFIGGHSVHCLASRTGKILWSYVKTGELHQEELAGNQVFVVTSDDRPAGTEHPTQGYNLVLIGAK